MANATNTWIERRNGIFYGIGFNLHPRHEFCSRYAREVIADAAGQTVGEVETFEPIFASRPDANLAFGKVWYFGRTPWHRDTVTPAGLLRSSGVRTVSMAG